MESAERETRSENDARRKSHASSAADEPRFLAAAQGVCVCGEGPASRRSLCSAFCTRHHDCARPGDAQWSVSSRLGTALYHSTPLLGAGHGDDRRRRRPAVQQRPNEWPGRAMTLAAAWLVRVGSTLPCRPTTTFSAVVLPAEETRSATSPSRLRAVPIERERITTHHSTPRSAVPLRRRQQA